MGEGPRDVVFVPGFVSHLEEVWRTPRIRGMFERLASFSRLMLLDKREQGLSDRVGRPPTLEEAMEDVRAVMDAAGSERAAVIGVSEGGPTAALLAATHPDRVTHLILVGTYARLTRSDDYPIGIPRGTMEGWEERLREDWSEAPALSYLAPSLVGDADEERAWGHFIRMGTSPRGAGALMNLYREIDVRPILPVVDVPTLVIHRAEDTAIRPAMGRYLAERIPGPGTWRCPGGTTRSSSATPTQSSTRSRSS